MWNFANGLENEFFFACDGWVFLGVLNLLRYVSSVHGFRISTSTNCHSDWQFYEVWILDNGSRLATCNWNLSKNTFIGILIIFLSYLCRVFTRKINFDKKPLFLGFVNFHFLRNIIVTYPFIVELNFISCLHLFPGYLKIPTENVGEFLWVVCN